MDKIKLLEFLNKDKNIVYQDNFFEMIKETSLLEFRKNVNIIQSYNPSLFLEMKIDKYYDEILSTFNCSSGLFLVYEKLLKCFRENNYSVLNDYSNYNYLVDKEMLLKLDSFRFYSDGEKRAYDELLEVTNQKISEIFVDGLFGDTIYNVWLNIKEMLNFYERLNDYDKFLVHDRLDFYYSILTIDKIKPSEKIKMYQELKNKNIALNFYSDLRKIKDMAYSRIKDNLFDMGKSSKLIYELNGEDFYMLVRCSKKYSNNCGVRRYCYSLISNRNMEVFDKNRFIYGYKNIPLDYILHVFENDAYSSNGGINSNYFYIKCVNRIRDIEVITNSKGYSEIQIVNKRVDNDSYDVIKPDYLVVFDNICDKHIEEATRLGIPIVKINTNYYINKSNNFSKVPYEKLFDDYTDGNYSENRRILRRLS